MLIDVKSVLHVIDTFSFLLMAADIHAIHTKKCIIEQRYELTSIKVRRNYHPKTDGSAFKVLSSEF
jgi:hypothetical protein